MGQLMISPERLRRFPLFAGLDHTTLKQLAKVCEEITLKAETWVFHEGDEADACYIVLQGTVELKIAINAMGVYSTHLTTLVEGDVLGWSALVEPYIYTTGAITLTETRLAKFDGVGLSEIMGHHPDVGYMLMSRLVEVVGSRLTNTRYQLVSLIKGSPWQQIDRDFPARRSNEGTRTPLN